MTCYDEEKLEHKQKKFAYSSAEYEKEINSPNFAWALIPYEKHDSKAIHDKPTKQARFEN